MLLLKTRVTLFWQALILDKVTALPNHVTGWEFNGFNGLLTTTLAAMILIISF